MSNELENIGSVTNSALTSSNQVLIKMLQQIPAAISMLVGPSFIIEMANEKSLEIWGKSLEQVIGKRTFDVFPELIDQGFDQILNHVYATGERFLANEAPVELVRHGQKEVIFINFSYDPIRNEAGEVMGIIGTGTDVTELVRAKQALIESNERSRLAIESAELGTWDYNPATNIIYCSDRTKELFGFDREDEITLEKALDAIVEKDKAKVISAIQEAMVPGSGGHYDVEYSLINYHTKKQQTIKAKGQVFFENEKPIRFIGTALNITQEVTAREEQKKLLTLVDNSIELMSILEKDGKNSYINKAGMEMLGFETLEEVNETPIANLHLPEDIAFVEANVLPAVINEGRWSGPMNVRHLKTGEVFPVYNNSVRIDDPVTGELMAIGAVMRDMRPELLAQQSVVASETKLRNVIEQASSPILILKGEDLVLEIANQALLDLWQVGRESIGKKFLEILPEMEGQGFQELLLNVFRSGTPHYGYEVPALFHRTNGVKELCYFNFVYQAYRELNNEISGVLVIANDVTGQVIAKNKLLKSEATLSLAVEAAHFGVYELDMVNQTIIHSPRAAEIFGLNPTQQWPFRYFTDAIHKDDVAIRLEAHERALKNGNLFYEARIFWPDGSLHWIRLNGRVIIENGKAISSVGTLIDITEEKKTAEILEEKIRLRTHELQVANENLARSNQQLEQFAHVASHDMKEPIRKVALFNDRLRSELTNVLTPQAESYIEKIEKSTNRLANMVEGVLLYSSINASEIRKEQVKLMEIMEQVEVDLELVIQQKHATLIYKDLPQLEAVPFLMYQLFYNLTNNALKFSKPGVPSEIAVHARKVQGTSWRGESIDPALVYFEISISDNGIGFLQENAETIFKTFSRLHSKDQYEGTGLGLALCRNIVEKHNGYIKAVGELDRGATFLILLSATAT